MKQNEFIAWLEGFLYDKVKLGAADINLIQIKRLTIVQFVN